MEKPGWHKDLETEIKQFDENNKIIAALLFKLIKIFNENHMNVEFHKIFATLLVYAQKEFALEEKLMNNSHYEQTMFHTNQHREFMKKMEYFATQYIAGEKPALEFRKYATKWIKSHIKVADKRIIPAVKEFFINN